MKLEEKADALSSKAMLVLAGYILCAAVNHVHDLWSQHGQLQVIQSQVVPKLKAQAAQVPVLKKKVGCEHWRADVSAQVAKDAIRGANSDSAPIPAPTAIPADNCQDSARK